MMIFANSTPPSRATQTCGRTPPPQPVLPLNPALDRLGSVVLANRNTAVIEEGDRAEYVFKVVAGALRTVRLLPDGRRHVANFLLPGDFFGFTETDTYTQGVEAVADATLVRYPRSSVEKVMETDPSLARRFLTMICGQLASTQDRLLLLGRKTAVERLATFLLAMAERTCTEQGDDREVDLPMSRGDIADYLGLTVETVSRVLSQLRSTKVIDLPSATHIVFLKQQALREMSAGAA